MYISLDILYEEGLLKAKAESFRENTVQIDYDAVRTFKEPYLREAFTAFCAQGKQNEDAYKDFASQDWYMSTVCLCLEKEAWRQLLE